MQHTGLSPAARARFTAGLSRVARPIERNANYHEILGERLNAFFQRYGFDITEGVLSPVDALTILDQSMVKKLTAVQMVPPGAAVAWGKTRNNLREFDFLRRVLRRHGLDDKIFNVSHHRTMLTKRMSSEPCLVDLRVLFKEYCESQWPLSPSTVYQLINYVHAYITWLTTFRESPALPRVLVLANDHSPNQVACTAVAQDLKIPTIYIQHAEVTTSFPGLAFDLSILRNQASLDVYTSVGPASGVTHIVSRDESPFRSDGFRQAVTGRIVVGVYLTAQVVWEGVRQVIQRLRANAKVDAVFVKPHPSQPMAVLALELADVDVRSDFLADPHVAVVANSSVVVELLHGGNIVFQHYGMDAVPRDYYGFSERGIAPEVTLDRLSYEFWLDFSPDERWRQAYQNYDPWAMDDYLENEKQLARDLGEYFPSSTGQASHFPANDGQAKAEQAFLNSNQLCRSLLQAAPHTVVDYVNEPCRFAPGRWGSARDLDFVSALNGMFADRISNSYELFGTTKRVSRVLSELVYVSKRRDIELTGRPTGAVELDEMTAYLVNNFPEPADSWADYVEFLMFLLRLNEEDRINTLFSSLPALPVKRLGINRRITLAKWLRENPPAQRALELIPAQLYSGLVALQRLKLRVLSATPAMFEKQGWTHEEIEQDFLAFASPGAQAHLSAIFLQCYERVRSQMQFMEVRWSLDQRQAFYALIENALIDLRPLSLVRLSDREAYMFADGGEYFTAADVENCERHWWRMQLPQNERDRMTALMRQASENADVLGIPSIYRLLRETDVKTKSLLTALQGRGLAEVARVVSQRADSHQLLTEEKCNIPLFSDLETVLKLCSFAKRTVLVSSASEAEARRLFRSITELKYVAIPTHSRTMSNHKYSASDRSLPEVYSDIRQLISNIVEPGDLVLVAGGVIGKIFVEDAKRAGGVALDVGTCLDDWVGAGIHSLH